MPMPPSINRQLASVKGRLIKTSEARNHEREISVFSLKHQSDCKKARIQIEQWIKDQGLQVDCFFVFHEERLLTKTKKAESWLKVLDANNRLKSSLDAISRIISVDDKYFVTGICEKVSCKSLDEERVIYRISPTKLRTVDQIQSQMNLDW